MKSVHSLWMVPSVHMQNETVCTLAILQVGSIIIPHFDAGEMRTQRFHRLAEGGTGGRQDLNPALSDSGTHCIALQSARMQLEI